MVRAMCGVQLTDRNKAKDMMLKLDLNKAIGQLAMASSVCWHGDMPRMWDGGVL